MIRKTFGPPRIYSDEERKERRKACALRYYYRNQEKCKATAMRCAKKHRIKNNAAAIRRRKADPIRYKLIRKRHYLKIKNTEEYRTNRWTKRHPEKAKAMWAANRKKKAHGCW